MFFLIDYSASVGSEEESGKDWDELEEEARKGMYLVGGGKKTNYAEQSFYYLAIMSNLVDEVSVHSSPLLSLTLLSTMSDSWREKIYTSRHYAMLASS